MSAPDQNAPIARTAQQSLAAEPEFSVWVSANAGTGKTRVLVDRIARLMLDGAPPEKILCLTFTKTAAAEMAGRINKQLGAWAMMDDGALAAQLSALSGREADAQTLETARTLFARVLDVPGGLKIRTIHSFCESLIGRFPIESKVAPNFTVIDERTTAELLAEAKERMLAKTVAAPDTPLANALSHMAELVGEDDFAKTMQDLMGKRDRLRTVLDAFEPLGLAEAVTRQAGLDPADTDLDAILQRAVRAPALDETAMHRAASALDQGAKTSKEKAGQLRAFLAMDEPHRMAAFERLYAPIFLTQKGEPLNAERTLTTKDARAADPALLDIMLAEQDRVLDVQERLGARFCADATHSLLVVAREMLAIFEHLKRVRAWLDYDDLIEKAQGLLSGHDGGLSWVHYKLDGGIDHILVDESQDTSPQQWDVVQGLATDFYAGLSRHEEQDDKPRTVFAVGDEKQSIYSFQGADPFEFGRMREHFKDRIQAARQQFRDATLNVSFRSTPAVLDMVDRVFNQPGASDGLTFGEQRADHQSSRTGHAGRVEVWPTITPIDDDDARPWDVPLDYTGQQSPPLRLAERIADTIRGWLDGGERLEATGQPITEGDILILVRRRGTFANAMVRALKSRGIQVAGADRMVLTDQLAVQDLLAAGRFAVLPEDDLAMAEVLKSPLVGWDDAALFDLAHDRAGGLWAALKRRRNEREDFRAAHGVLANLLARADTQPPHEFYASLLRDGARRAFLQRLGPDAEDPIDEFLAAALNFEHNHTPSLEGFAHWVNAASQTIKRDMESTGAEVRVMTVHGAKGLEAPVVFLADTCKAPNKRQAGKLQWSGVASGDDGDPGVLWAPFADQRPRVFTDAMDAELHEQQREYRRLLYVAMTRAADRLYVTGFEDKDGRTDGCWYDLIQPVIEGVGREIDVDGATGWRYATQQEAEVKAPEAQEPTTPPGPLPAWATEPAPKEPTPTRPLQPTRPTPEAPPALGPFEAHDETRFKRGLVVHKLLEALPDVPQDEREARARAWLARPGLELSADLQADILQETLAVLRTPSLQDLFAPESLAEVSVSGVLGGEVVAARLDRLWVGPDRVDVIDYKTNRPAPTDPADVPEAYLRQMATYRALLANLYPDRRIRCVLLWTDGPHAMVLDEAMLRAYAPEDA